MVSFVIVNTHPFVPYYCNTSQWNVYDVEKILKKRGERIRRRWVATASATKDINEKEIINVYSSGPFLFFLFCFVSFSFSSFRL